MKIIGLVFLVTLLSLSTVFAQQQADNYGKPLIILVETNPWLMVIGSDLPTFVIYEKGQVIYKKAEGEKLKIYEAKLSPDESKKIIESFSISDKFFALPENIDASVSTDQPSNILYINLDKKKRVSVYGRLEDKSEARKNTPQEFLTVYDTIKKFDNTSAHEWMPEKIEVMFWNYDYAPKSKKWPPELPDLNSASTIKSSDGMYSVFIDQKDFDKFKTFYSSIGEKQAVEINGKKMAISYRTPFPNLL